MPDEVPSPEGPNKVEEAVLRGTLPCLGPRLLLPWQRPFDYSRAQVVAEVNMQQVLLPFAVRGMPVAV